MKSWIRSGVLAAVAAGAVLGTAACLKELDEPKVTHGSGDYPAEVTVTFSGVKPADCHTLRLEIRNGSTLVDTVEAVGDSEQTLTSRIVTVTATSRLEATLAPGPSCWVYLPKVVAFDYRIATPEPPDMTVVEPPDMSVPPDLMPPPDLTTPPDLTDPCFDNMKDGDETDVDCGGPTCAARCGDRQMCVGGRVPSDCALGFFCSGNTCLGS